MIAQSVEALSEGIAQLMRTIHGHLKCISQVLDMESNIGRRIAKTPHVYVDVMALLGTYNQ
jgi:poly(3-hydroxyalkanoate) synthetase